MRTRRLGPNRFIVLYPLDAARSWSIEWPSEVRRTERYSKSRQHFIACRNRSFRDGPRSIDVPTVAGFQECRPFVGGPADRLSRRFSR